MIAVAGATGTVGRELVAQLSATGQPVRSMTRDPRAAEALLPETADPIACDFERPESLTRAFDSVDRLFLLTGHHPRQAGLERNLLSAAAIAGVRFVVKLSGSREFVADDSPVTTGREHAAAEAALRQSGIDHAVLRPVYFMQNLLPLAPVVAAKGMLPLPLGDARIAVVDARDVAAVATTMLISPGDHIGADVAITGPKVVSFADIAAIVGAAIGSDIRYVPLSDAAARAAMTEQGHPAWQIDHVLEAARAYQSVGGATTAAVSEITGHEAISPEQFVRDHVASFA